MLLHLLPLVLLSTLVTAVQLPANMLGKYQLGKPHVRILGASYINTIYHEESCLTIVIVSISIPKVKNAVLKNLPQSVRLLEGRGVEMLFGRMPFEHAVSLHGASLSLSISTRAIFWLGL